MANFSTRRISSELINEIARAIKSVNNFGSVEIYIQNGVVTQLTVRKIKKTKELLSKKGDI